MYRGRNLYGPGFWKGGRGQFSGTGPGAFRGVGPGRGWCRYWVAGGAPGFGVPPWAGPYAAGEAGAGTHEAEWLKAEAAALRAEAEAIDDKLAEIEKRMVEIERPEEA